jgi:hypothetical protein
MIQIRLYFCPLAGRSYYPRRRWLNWARTAISRGTTALKLTYLLASVGKGVQLHHRKDDKEYVSVGIGQLTQGTVLLLPCRVPQPQIDQSALDPHGRCQIIKNGRVVLGGKLVLSVTA